MNPRGKDLALAISSMDEEKLIQFALQNKSKRSPFTFKEVLQELSAEEIDEMWEQLRQMIVKHSKTMFEKNDTGSNKNEVCLESSQILQAAIDLAQVILDESLPVSQGLLHMVVFLNGILFEIPSILESLRNNIAHLCEKMYHLNYVNQNQYFTSNTLIYLLKRTLSSKATKKDVKRIYALRSLIPKVLAMENVDANEIWDLFKKCAASNLYGSMHEGQKILTLTLELDVDRVSDIHSVIMKKMSSCSKKHAACYGKAYFEAWSHSVKSKDEKLKNELEISCIQDLVLQTIIRRPKPVIDSLRKLLNQFHCQKKEAYVSKMLYDLYQPILWRYLKHPDGLLRAHAAQLFLDVFPLEDPDYKVVTSDIELNDQFLIIKDLLLDDYPIVRTTTVSRLCFTMSAHWELFPEDILKTYFKIIINELSCDSSSAEVRTAVAKGFKALLENPLTMTTLQTVLPKLKHLFHDISDSVRIAFCQVLLRVKQICAIKYFDIVPLEDLLARLEEDQVTAKLIVNLIHNSFFPKDKGTETWLIRCANIIKKNPAASRVLFQYIPHFTQPEVVAKFISQAVQSIHFFVQSTVTSKRVSTAKRRSSRGSKAESSDVPDPSDLYSLGLACGFDDPGMVSGFMDAFVIMWLASVNTLKKPENKKELKKMVGKLSKCLSDLALHFKDSKVFLSIAYLGSYIAAVNIPCLASLCFMHLKNMTEDSDRREYTTLLRCLCNQSQEGSLLALLKDWIKSAFLQTIDTPPPKKRKKSKGVAEEMSFPRHRLAVRMYNFLLEDKLCQKIILSDQTDRLNDFLDLFDHLKRRIELLCYKNIPEEEMDFLKELFHVLVKTSALMEHKSSECRSIKFVDEVVSWTQDTLCKLAWPSSNPNASVRRRSSKQLKCSSSFENISLIICKDVCTLAGDVACLGLLNVKASKYAKFGMKILNTDQGPSLMLSVSKLLWKHIYFGVYLCAVQKQDSVLHIVPDCFSKMLSCLSVDTFLEAIPPNDARDIHGCLSQSLLTMYHHGVLKETMSDIMLCFVKNVLTNIVKSMSEIWDSFEKDCEPFSTIQVSKCSAFLLSIIFNRQKILVYFLHQLNKYITKCEKDVQSWVACCIILLQATEAKSVSKNLKKEINSLKNTLGKILLELYPLNPDDLNALTETQLQHTQTRLCEVICEDEMTAHKPEVKEIKALSFNMHCHFEMKKLRDILQQKIQGTSKMVEN